MAKRRLADAFAAFEVTELELLIDGINRRLAGVPVTAEIGTVERRSKRLGLGELIAATHTPIDETDTDELRDELARLDRLLPPNPYKTEGVAAP